MGNKSELLNNNTSLQSILDTITAMGGESNTSSTFIHTNSGGSGHRSKLTDNNIDLQRILDKIKEIFGIDLTIAEIEDMTLEELENTSIRRLDGVDG